MRRRGSRLFWRNATPSSKVRRASLVCVLLLLSIPAAAEKPNVVLILVDDLRPVMTSFGGPVSTPGIDALAHRGVRFTNNYANVPVCGASRASMLSGLAPSATRFLSYDSRLDQDVPEAETLPGYFRRHGWYVVGNGKIFDVIDDSAQSWSEPVWNPPMRWYTSSNGWSRRTSAERLCRAAVVRSPAGHGKARG